MPQENDTTTTSSTQNSKIDSTELFNRGLALQQQKKWDEALLTYSQLTDIGPQELSSSQASVVYHNMSSIAYEKGDFAKAYIWSKKAMSLNSQNRFAKENFELISAKFTPPTIPHQISNFEQFKQLTSYFPVDFWCVLSLLCFFILLKLITKNLLSLKTKVKTKGFSNSKSFLVTILLATMLVIWTTALKFDESFLKKGLILAEVAPVQTAPGENKSVIFEAKLGLEIEVIGSEANYLQIRFPGAFSGWVLKNQVEILGF